MKSIPRLCVGLLVVTGLLAAFSPPPPPAPSPVAPKIDGLARGAYLAQLGGCNDCHSPKLFGPQGPSPDPARLLSGHPADAALPTIPPGVVGPQAWGALATGDLTAWVGPWGTSFAANLTPDPTGLGAWTEDTFVKAIRSGKHAGVGRPILPPMPWNEYAQMTDADLKALWAYLRTVKPVANVVPEPMPP